MSGDFVKSIFLSDTLRRLLLYLVLREILSLNILCAEVIIDFEEGIDHLFVTFEEAWLEDIGELKFLRPDEFLRDFENVLKGVYTLDKDLPVLNNQLEFLVSLDSELSFVTISLLFDFLLLRLILRNILLSF